ncbi:hypothetical protein [Bowdeniella nasicola]|uniref:hypothetical protein n=1 Tax=Bowdeniella nasicola TaxID=208480 RepID=UPI000A72F79A|nr:hypothetical protein [Bowdeniella nasicola]
MLHVLRNPSYAKLFSAQVITLIGTGLLTVALGLPWVSEAWQIYVLIFVLQAASATFTPTFQAIIPEILPDERDYTAALSLSRLAYDLESVLSPHARRGAAHIPVLQQPLPRHRHRICRQRPARRGDRAATPPTRRARTVPAAADPRRARRSSSSTRSCSSCRASSIQCPTGP